MKKAQHILFILIFAICSCEHTEKEVSMSSDDHPYQPVSNVPQTQTIGTYNFRLEAHLARNFMPIIPSSGAPLVAVISLVETEQKNIKGKFELQTFKIAAFERTWEPSFLTDTSFSNPYEIRRVSHDGPQLKPGRFVDVIGEFKSLETGKTYDILASKLEIKRSE